MTSDDFCFRSSTVVEVTQGLQNLMHQKFGMLVDPLRCESEGWLGIRKPKNLNLLVTFLWLSMRIIIYHFPTVDLVACISFVYLCDSFSNHRLEITKYMRLPCYCIRVLHVSCAFHFLCLFRGWISVRMIICCIYLSFPALREVLLFSSYKFEFRNLQSARPQKYPCWILQQPFGSVIMFPSTWGCRKEKKIPKMLQTSLPHLRGHLVGGSSFSSLPQLSEKRSIGKKCLRKRGAPFENWLVACGSNKHSVLT